MSTIIKGTVSEFLNGRRRLEPNEVVYFSYENRMEKTYRKFDQGTGYRGTIDTVTYYLLEDWPPKYRKAGASGTIGFFEYHKIITKNEYETARKMITINEV